MEIGGIFIIYTFSVEIEFSRLCAFIIENFLCLAMKEALLLAWKVSLCALFFTLCHSDYDTLQISIQDKAQNQFPKILIWSTHSVKAHSSSL